MTQLPNNATHRVPKITYCDQAQPAGAASPEEIQAAYQNDLDTKFDHGNSLVAFSMMVAETQNNRLRRLYGAYAHRLDECVHQNLIGADDSTANALLIKYKSQLLAAIALVNKRNKERLDDGLKVWCTLHGPWDRPFQECITELVVVTDAHPGHFVLTSIEVEPDQYQYRLGLRKHG